MFCFYYFFSLKENATKSLAMNTFCLITTISKVFEGSSEGKRYLKLEELSEQAPSLHGLPQSAETLLLKALISSYLIEQRVFSPHSLHLFYRSKSTLLTSHHDL